MNIEETSSHYINIEVTSSHWHYINIEAILATSSGTT